MPGHIEKRTLKDGSVRWRAVIETGSDADLNRIRRYKSFDSRKEAEAWKTQALHELAIGTYIEPDKITLAEFLHDWLETYARPNLTPSTVDGYTVNLEKHVIPQIGHIQLQELRPMHLQKLYLNLIENGRRDGTGGLSARSVQYIHRNLRSALAYAFKMQMVQKNVADFVTLPKSKRYQSRVYNEEELLKLMQLAKDDRILNLVIALGAGLGLRRGEICGLRWEDVDLDNKLVHIKNNRVPTSMGIIEGQPKTETSRRTIDLPDGLLQILLEYKTTYDINSQVIGQTEPAPSYVLSKGDGSPYDPSYIGRRFKAFLKENDLPLIRLHDLRHTNATMMLLYGVPAKVASARLGHSGIGITLDLYSHVLGEMQRDAADKLDAGIFQKLQPVTGGQQPCTEQ